LLKVKSVNQLGGYRLTFNIKYSAEAIYQQVANLRHICTFEPYLLKRSHRNPAQATGYNPVERLKVTSNILRKAVKSYPSPHRHTN